MKKFNRDIYPNTYSYVVKNDTRSIRCNRCGTVALKEIGTELKKEYPYQCMDCDENMYSIETHNGEEHEDDEFDELCWRTLELLCLD